jgi:hypothetical protein
MAADDLTWPLLGDVAIGAAFGFFSGPLGLVMVFAVPITDLRLATGRWAWE